MSTEDDTFKKLRQVHWADVAINSDETWAAALERQGWEPEEWRAKINAEAGADFGERMYKMLMELRTPR